MEAPPLVERPFMEAGQGDEQVLHILVSNQSLTIPVADIQVTINGKQVFHREMAAGTQHHWSEIALPIVSGEHLVVLTEANTHTHMSATINVNREVWMVVKFASPPPEFQMEVLDHPVAFM